MTIKTGPPHQDRIWCRFNRACIVAKKRIWWKGHKYWLWLEKKSTLMWLKPDIVRAHVNLAWLIMQKIADLFNFQEGNSIDLLPTMSENLYRQAFIVFCGDSHSSPNVAAIFEVRFFSEIKYILLEWTIGFVSIQLFFWVLLTQKRSFFASHCQLETWQFRQPFRDKLPMVLLCSEPHSPPPYRGRLIVLCQASGTWTHAPEIDWQATERVGSL